MISDKPGRRADERGRERVRADTWLDDGTHTSPNPLDPNLTVRWYRAQVAESHPVFVGTPQNLSGGIIFAANGPPEHSLKWKLWIGMVK